MIKKLIRNNFARVIAISSVLTTLLLVGGAVHKK